MFSEGNGGESRKSFHGYPAGYAQLITSPTQWHITPMQIDTRNRECGVGPEHIKNCTQFTPWMEPKQSRYGRGIPEGTNYSGILECPCNEGYGGDPEFYGAASKTKIETHQYSAIAAGSCGSSASMSGPTDCFGSAPQLGLNASQFVNKTISDPSAPSGCSVVVSESGVATVTWNTVAGAACTSSGSKVGQATSAVGVTVGIVISETGNAKMVRNKLGRQNSSAWCTDNKDKENHANPKPFVAKALTPAAMTAALEACEAYCMSNPSCNFCSVDDFDQVGKIPRDVQW
jgi:hypothetical protein